ncbi:MAG: endolytic transglycosylase MltG, partial [Epsilonproteobacteria bacterium]|nr:endolytic transglycosylase MltG [Campylobacterota bacterium]
SSIETKRNIKVVSNNPAEVIESLNKDGYNLTFLDRLYMRYFAPPLAGNVYINKTKLARYQFLKKLSYKSTHYTPITIIPGETTYFVLQDIAKKLNFNLIKLAKIYKEEAPFSEGNFLAETYNIPLYFDERATIKFLIKSSFKVYKRVLAQNKIEYSNKTLKRYLIIASIIQKEAANNKEMPLIASVIYNRLKKNMRLQMDGSLNYGKYSHQKITPERIKSDKSFYNTYKFKGLPKEPVCNVSLNALKAAINPAKSEYLYFMKKDEKSHSFSKEYKSHLNNIKKRKKELSKE